MNQITQTIEQLPKYYWCENHCHAECANLIYGDSYVASSKPDEYTGELERECSCSCQYPKEATNFSS